VALFNQKKDKKRQKKTKKDKKKTGVPLQKWLRMRTNDWLVFEQ